MPIETTELATVTGGRHPQLMAQELGMDYQQLVRQYGAEMVAEWLPYEYAKAMG